VKFRIAVPVAALALGLTVAGCSSTNPTNTGSTAATSSGSSASSTAAPSASGSQIVAPFNDVDVRFVQGMLPHHMQAVRNAEIEVATGGAPEVKAIAQKILDGQRVEIATMQGFLKTFGAPEQQAPQDQQAVWDKNTADLQAAATPKERDVIFLTNMVPHHSAAIPMAQLDITQGKYPQAQALAMQIKTTQRMEIVEMNMMIRART